jgi:iron-sulfur cluster assembly protein
MNEVVSQSQIIELTEPAAEHLREMLAKEEDEAKSCFRVYVEEGGCSGMQYGMTFDEARDGDEVLELKGVKVLVDSFSAKYLRGTRVDYSDSLNDGGFKIVNPNASQSCGCGKSFET